MCANFKLIVIFVLIALTTLLMSIGYFKRSLSTSDPDISHNGRAVKVVTNSSNRLSRKERMIVHKIFLEMPKQNIIDRRHLIVRCCGSMSCTYLPKRKRKRIVVKKKKRTTTPSEYEEEYEDEDAVTEDSGSEVSTAAADETTAAADGETTGAEETTVEEASTEEVTTEGGAGDTTAAEESTTVNASTTVVVANSTTPALTTTTGTTTSTSTSTTTTSTTTTTTPTTTIHPCNVDTCLPINCADPVKNSSTSESLLMQVLGGEPIPPNMLFTTQEACGKIYKIVGGAAIGDYEDAVRVCCMLQMRPLKLESAEKLGCISNMLRTIDGGQPWTVWTSARQRILCNTTTYHWCPAYAGPVNNSLWSPGFPTKYDPAIPAIYAPRCAILKISYNNSQPITTFENSGCDLLNPIVCEV